MARILPLNEAEWSPSLKDAFQKHILEYNGRVTNMKATLGHSSLVFDTYMRWYPLYEEVKLILGDRLAGLFAYFISKSTNCSLSATFFRKLIIDAGENPEDLALTEHEKNVIDFACTVVKYQGSITDCNYNIVSKKYGSQQMLILIAFAGQMIAANIVNNIIETDIDEYLFEYLPPVKSFW